MNQNGNDRWRKQPMYSYAEVARLSGVSQSTVRNWLLGYFSDRGEVKPLFSGHSGEEKSCSFLELIEIVVAARFRKGEHASFKTVRQAYDNAKRIYQLDYPFASLELKAIGGHIVHIMHVPGLSLQAVDQPEQFTIPDLVQEAIAQLDYESDLASRWYPAGKEVPIVIDPRISAGMPVVKDRGITIDAILKRFKAKQKMDFIAKDLAINIGTVEEVIRFRETVAV